MDLSRHPSTHRQPSREHHLTRAPPSKRPHRPLQTHPAIPQTQRVPMERTPTSPGHRSQLVSNQVTLGFPPNAFADTLAFTLCLATIAQCKGFLSSRNPRSFFLLRGGILSSNFCAILVAHSAGHTADQNQHSSCFLGNGLLTLGVASTT